MFAPATLLAEANADFVPGLCDNSSSVTFSLAKHKLQVRFKKMVPAAKLVRQSCGDAPRRQTCAELVTIHEVYLALSTMGSLQLYGLCRSL